MNKSEVRKLLLKSRGEIINRTEKDLRIYERLQDIAEKTKPESVFCYVSMNSEADTKKFIKNNFGKIPIYVPFTENGIMVPRLLTDVSDLSTDKLGNVKKDYLGETADTCALSVIPLVGFNKNKHRMGYGGGYYDRYLSVHQTFSIGIAYDEQLFEDLPVESYDAKLNIIITQDNFYL